MISSLTIANSRVPYKYDLTKSNTFNEIDAANSNVDTESIRNRILNGEKKFENKGFLSNVASKLVSWAYFKRENALAAKYNNKLNKLEEKILTNNGVDPSKNDASWNEEYTRLTDEIKTAREALNSADTNTRQQKVEYKKILSLYEDLENHIENSAEYLGVKYGDALDKISKEAKMCSEAYAITQSDPEKAVTNKVYIDFKENFDELRTAFNQASGNDLLTEKYQAAEDFCELFIKQYTTQSDNEVSQQTRITKWMGKGIDKLADKCDVLEAFLNNFPGMPAPDKVSQAATIGATALGATETAMAITVFVVRLREYSNFKKQYQGYENANTPIGKEFRRRRDISMKNLAMNLVDIGEPGVGMITDALAIEGAKAGAIGAMDAVGPVLTMCIQIFKCACALKSLAEYQERYEKEKSLERQYPTVNFINPEMYSAQKITTQVITDLRGQRLTGAISTNKVDATTSGISASLKTGSLISLFIASPLVSIPLSIVSAVPDIISKLLRKVKESKADKQTHAMEKSAENILKNMAEISCEIQTLEKESKEIDSELQGELSQQKQEEFIGKQEKIKSKEAILADYRAELTLHEKGLLMQDSNAAAENILKLLFDQDPQRELEEFQEQYSQEFQKAVLNGGIQTEKSEALYKYCQAAEQQVQNLETLKTYLKPRLMQNSRGFFGFEQNFSFEENVNDIRSHYHSTKATEKERNRDKEIAIQMVQQLLQIKLKFGYRAPIQKLKQIPKSPMVYGLQPKPVNA